MTGDAADAPSGGLASDVSDAGRAGAAAPYGPGVARLVDPARADGVRLEAAAGPPPSAAATVVLLRDGADGSLEVFLVQRASRLPFMGGAHVFAGGKVDRADPSPEACAVREVEEETTVRLDVRALAPWSRWVTPAIEPRRFDALFYLAALPPGETARAVEGEVTGGLWIAPAAAIARAGARAMTLPPPTLWTLGELLCFASAEAALAEARGRTLATIETFAPRALDLGEGRLALVLAGDPAYEPSAAPGGASAGRERRFILDDGRWIVRGHPGLDEA